MFPTFADRACEKRNRPRLGKKALILESEKKDLNRIVLVCSHCRSVSYEALEIDSEVDFESDSCPDDEDVQSMKEILELDQSNKEDVRLMNI